MDRSSFAHHWQLDGEVDFLNHGSFGACPTVVLSEQREWRARIEREPVRFFETEFEAALDAVRARLAAFVGADPDDLALLPNATTGVNTVLRGLRLEPEDELLVTNHGYNACRNAVDFAARRAGARVVVARVPFPIAGPQEVVDAVLGAVGPRTRLALIDHITSPTGLVFPVAELVAALRERGVETLVDGAHGPGMVPLDLDALGAAYYAGNAHKWLCTPKGCGLLHVRRDLQADLHPLVISHGANDPRSGRSRFRLEFDWLGTGDPSPYLVLPTALDFLEGLLPGGWPELMQRNRSLALEGRDILAAALGVEAPAPDSMLAALASLPLPRAPAEAPPSRYSDPLQDVLVERHAIQVPIIPWDPLAARYVRISAQLYNSADQVRRLAEALRAEL